MARAFPSGVHVHPCSRDLLATAAAWLLDHAGERLPDLGHLTVLVDGALAAGQLRRRLAEQAATRGHDALLGPRIGPLAEWVRDQVPPHKPVLSTPARQLLIVDALRGHRGLLGEDDPWRLGEQLLALFDELVLNQTDLPLDETGMEYRLAAGYGIDGRPPEALAHEARIVLTLWRAWLDELAALGVTTPADVHALQLEQAAADLPADAFFLILGDPAGCRAEQRLLETLLERGQALWLRHGHHRDAGEAATDPATVALDTLYGETEPALRDRAARCAASLPDSPLRGRLACLAAVDAEQEAAAVDLQVRRWLLDGLRSIGIVTDDRRLARRVRALLERAGVTLSDRGGWALSTTSAAAALERWLECVEEDFPCQPLLDLLKSPFLTADGERDEHLRDVHRLENDIMRRERVTRGLDRYRAHVEYRDRRIGRGTGNWSDARRASVLALLDRLETAARPLSALLRGRHPAATLLQQTRQSLQALGLWAGFEADAAGRALLGVWEQLAAAARRMPTELGWVEFRTWLGRALEAATFRPAQSPGPVVLLTPDQAALCRFDGLILAACDHRQLPGPPPARPFFNERVRRDFGLPNWPEELARRLGRFRSLLQAAPRVLICWRERDGDEPLLPSPWVEALQAFHRHAWGDNLAATGLQALLESPHAQVAPPAPAVLPSPEPRPRPAADPALRPERLSASSHQSLIDCPYRFLAGHCLHLKAREEVREVMEKSEYGGLVHQCLEAFHKGAESFPGPFREPFDAAHRAAAIELLTRISRAVFARDLEDNFEHRGWYRRWLDKIPSYVDWQIERAARGWEVCGAEVTLERELAPGLRLGGRPDRLDRSEAGTAVLDFKTGKAARLAEVEAGEAVQLPTYALLTETLPARVEYVLLDEDRVRNGATLEGERLATLATAVGERLAQVVTAIDAGSPMPAWEHPDSCRHCDMDGLCRRQTWGKIK